MLSQDPVSAPTLEGPESRTQSGQYLPISRPFSEVAEPSQGDLQMTQEGGVLGQLRSPGCPASGSIEGTPS